MNAGKEAIGGIAPLEGPGPSHWLPYISVVDVDEAARRSGLLGGKVKMPPTDIPNVGRCAIIEDPTGASVALFKA